MTGFRVKDWFFDRRRVIDAIGKAKVKYYSKVGAFVRRRAQTSMRRQKNFRKYSAPGKPPFAHAGHLRELLFFSYDSSTDSVVVGPIPYRKGEVPALHEHGGKAQRRCRGRAFAATYPPRSFMGPALAAEEPKLPDYWQDAVKAT